MGIHGNLSTMSVSDLLQFLATAKKTGTLRIDRGKVVKQIYFENGLIVGSGTNDPKEYLGQLLIHYGKIDEAQLKAAMQIQRNSGGRLGEILITTRVLGEGDVLEILRIRTLDIIYDLFIWDEAHFEFFDNEPLPDDLSRIEVEATSVIMDGIYRIDEWARYRMLIPSDRTVLELAPGWTSALETANKEVRQMLYFIEKHMSVAEICYNMHAAPFHVYGQLCELVSNGLARVAGEAPENAPTYKEVITELPETIPELLGMAREKLEEEDPETSITLIQQVLQTDGTNVEAKSLLGIAEEKFVKKMYASVILPHAVPKLLVSVDGLEEAQLAPQEGFILSRINGEWDIRSILSICPFREPDSLRMLKRLLDNGIIGF
jgi:hypothetical protein